MSACWEVRSAVDQTLLQSSEHSRGHARGQQVSRGPTMFGIKSLKCVQNDLGPRGKTSYIRLPLAALARPIVQELLDDRPQALLRSARNLRRSARGKLPPGPTARRRRG